MNGLTGISKKNVLAYLGDEPESVPDRLNFVVSAREKVERGLQALGYYRPIIDIDLQRTDPVWQLAISVALGDPVRIRELEIEILGAATEDPEFTSLISGAGLSAGEIFHHGLFEDFRKQLLALGQRRGYLDGVIDESRVEVQVESGTADIKIRYDSGKRFRFGEIVYDESFINKNLFDPLLTFEPGEYFDQSKLQRFQSELQKTNYFSSVII